MKLVLSRVAAVVFTIATATNMNQALATGTINGSPADNQPIDVNFTFRYETANPTTINNRPVLNKRYWSCVDTATVTFARPMRLATVLGKVYATNRYGGKRAPVLKTVSRDLRSFVFSFAPASLCNDHRQLNRVVVSKEVRNLDGAQLSQDFAAPINYPASRDQASDSLSAPASVADDTPSESERAAVCEERDPTRCITITPERLNAAMLAMRTWSATERHVPLYQGRSLKLLPLEHLLKPYSPANHARHFGSADLLYVLRRAARFTELLFPDLDAIAIADLSAADGGTPQVDGILLHPEGSHVDGRDADVAYITMGPGNTAGAAWHFERNFWFTYAVLQSTGVDLVITAYKDELRRLAGQAYQRGLINSIAVGRFNTLMNDQELNHDKHLHISVRNSDNQQGSRMFSPTDDVYACYLGLRPDHSGGNYNYCEGT